MARTAPTYAEWLQLYPGFAAVPKAQIESQLSLSIRLLSANTWREFYSDAVGLDAAHNLCLQRQAATNPQDPTLTAGPITSANVGGISASFAQPNWSDKSAVEQWYMKTVYGQQFLRLRTACCPVGGLAA